MKSIRIILLITAAALCLSCEHSGDSAVKAGKNIGEIYVTAAPGSRSVLVSLDDLWRVRSCEDWISTDVNGRDGEGAFTFRYGSNESDFFNSNPVRRGAIVIQSLKTMTADTLYVRQQGLPDGKEYQSVPKDSYIEFLEDSFKSVSVLYANVQGADEAAAGAWIASVGAVINCIVWDDSLSVSRSDSAEMDSVEKLTAPEAIVASTEGLNLAVSDFGYVPDNAAGYYESMRSLLNGSYDKPGAGDLWLVGGSFYYLSVMEAGYPSTPSWYPEDPSADAFAADRYAQSANLTDCVWMTVRDFTPTWSAGGQSWRADYLYASSGAWTTVTSVKLLDSGLAGASHKAVLVNLKY